MDNSILRKRLHAHHGGGREVRPSDGIPVGDTTVVSTRRTATDDHGRAAVLSQASEAATQRTLKKDSSESDFQGRREFIRYQEINPRRIQPKVRISNSYDTSTIEGRRFQCLESWVGGARARCNPGPHHPPHTPTRKIHRPGAPSSM